MSAWVWFVFVFGIFMLAITYIPLNKFGQSYMLNDTELNLTNSENITVMHWFQSAWIWFPIIWIVFGLMVWAYMNTQKRY